MEKRNISRSEVKRLLGDQACQALDEAEDGGSLLPTGAKLVIDYEGQLMVAGYAHDGKDVADFFEGKFEGEA